MTCGRMAAFTGRCTLSVGWGGAYVCWQWGPDKWQELTPGLALCVLQRLLSSRLTQQQSLHLPCASTRGHSRHAAIAAVGDWMH